MATNTPAITDFGQFTKLRAEAKTQSPEAIKAAAKQFEALFTQQLLKSMRAASLGDDVMGGEQTEFYQDLFDQQMAVHLSAGKGLGIADLMIRQLQHQGATASASPLPPFTGEGRDGGSAVGALKSLKATPPPQPSPVNGGGRQELTGQRAGFVQELWPHAEKAAKELGISPRTLIAQAALETDWGRHMIRQSDGSSSLNFFGIKADKRWDGARASSATTEYVNGKPESQSAQFRSYGSVAEAFDDYVRFVRENPRYQDALAHGGSDQKYAAGLQQAGYATDPRYADKIRAVSDSVVQSAGKLSV